MAKFILCDTATPDHGKTQTLLKVIEKLKLMFAPEKDEPTTGVDRYASFQIDGKRIVVNTMGDPIPEFEKYLMQAVEEDAKVIICASRTGGNTFEEINRHDDNYKIIRFSNFYSTSDNPLFKPYLLDDMAQAIVQLALKLLAL